MSKRKRPCLLPSLHTACAGWAELSLSLTVCGLAEKTHTLLCFSSVNHPRHEWKTERYYTSLLSRRVNNTCVVYSGTFCTLQNQHNKPWLHVYTSVFYLGPHAPHPKIKSPDLLFTSMAQGWKQRMSKPWASHFRLWLWLTQTEVPFPPPETPQQLLVRFIWELSRAYWLMYQFPDGCMLFIIKCFMLVTSY